MRGILKEKNINCDDLFIKCVEVDMNNLHFLITKTNCFEFGGGEELCAMHFSTDLNIKRQLNIKKLIWRDNWTRLCCVISFCDWIWWACDLCRKKTWMNILVLKVKWMRLKCIDNKQTRFWTDIQFSIGAIEFFWLADGQIVNAYTISHWWWAIYSKWSAII